MIRDISYKNILYSHYGVIQVIWTCVSIDGSCFRSDTGRSIYKRTKSTGIYNI